jgi:hypothetical protein
VGPSSGVWPGPALCRLGSTWPVQAYHPQDRTPQREAVVPKVIGCTTVWSVQSSNAPQRTSAHRTFRPERIRSIQQCRPRPTPQDGYGIDRHAISKLSCAHGRGQSERPSRYVHLSRPRSGLKRRTPSTRHWPMVRTTARVRWRVAARKRDLAVGRRLAGGGRRAVQGEPADRDAVGEPGPDWVGPHARRAH